MNSSRLKDHSKQPFAPELKDLSPLPATYVVHVIKTTEEEEEEEAYSSKKAMTFDI